MSDWYILDKNHNPVKVDVISGAASMEDDRLVASTTVGEANISTVFLGFDHNFGNGPPILFETMVFGGFEDGFQERYTTWAKAEAGHKRAVILVSSRAENDQQ